MIPADMALNGFTTSRIDDMRAIRIFYFRRQITNYIIARIIHTHVWSVFGPLLTDNCLLKSSRLKSYLPVVHTFNEIRNPFLRCGRVYIEDDGLNGFHQLSPTISLHVFWHQTKSSYELLTVGLMLIIIKISHTVCKVPHTLVPKAFTHGRLRQHDKTGIES